METRKRAAPLTGLEFRQLRLHMGLTPEALAVLMDCGVQTIYNIESAGVLARIGRPMVRLLTLLLDPDTRDRVECLVRVREQLLHGGVS